MVTTIQDELRAELEEIAERFGCELLHLDFGGGRLRLVLDRAEGVTLSDCERVSREASALLDIADFGPQRYTLEVSSPGLDREFYSARDYERFCGRTVKVTWRDPETGRKRTDLARLAEVLPDSRGDLSEIAIEIGSTRRRIPLADVLSTRLEPDL